MVALNPAVEVGCFFRELAEARSRLLLLDFDGTLAPFAARPEEARPYRGIASLLDDIMRRSENRVVILTGRDLRDHAPRIGLRRRPEVWGAHGWQRWPPAEAVAEYEPPPAAKDRLLAAAAYVQRLAHWGARIERKTGSVAVHWRGLDLIAAEAVREALGHAWRGPARTRELELIEFDGGLELRVRGRDKGVVVSRLLDECGDGTVAAYLGDDLTDESAFSALRGRGLGVLVRPVARRTAAQLWLRPPEDLEAFLERWRDCAPARRQTPKTPPRPRRSPPPRRSFP